MPRSAKLGLRAVTCHLAPEEYGMLHRLSRLLTEEMGEEFSVSRTGVALLLSAASRETEARRPDGYSALLTFKAEKDIFEADYKAKPTSTIRKQLEWLDGKISRELLFHKFLNCKAKDFAQVRRDAYDVQYLSLAQRNARAAFDQGFGNLEQTST